MVTTVSSDGPATSGEITAVSRRRAAPRRPRADSRRYRSCTSNSLDFTSPASGQEGRLDLVGPIFPMSFARVGPPWTSVCPICLDPHPLTREHVPQGALGGTEMTTTCQQCNNEFGSRFEVELQHWFDGALVDVRFEQADVRGARKGPRIYVLSSEGKVMLVPDAELADEVNGMLEAGTFTLRYRFPDTRRILIALLKHAYLAACLYLGYVPDIDEAVDIRKALLAARSAPRSEGPPDVPAADRLAVYLSGRPAAGPPLAIMETQPAETTQGVPRYLISLAGTVFVSWPFSVVPERKAPGLGVGLIVRD